METGPGVTHTGTPMPAPPGVDQDELRQVRRQLAQAEARANRAEKSRAGFCARMSHELRTPLCAIMGFAQLLEDEAGLEGEQGDNLREIQAAGSHLRGLIDQIIEQGRHDAAGPVPSRERVDLASLVPECLALLRPLALRHGVRLRHCLRARHLVTDRTRLKQVLLNLLSNAIKYNREGGRVDLHTLPGHNAVRIEVHDTGRGISPGHMSSLFQPFERLDADDAALPGHGLGLVISRHLTSLLQGRLQVLSAPGQGSIFWFDLPLPSAAADEQGRSPQATPADALKQVYCLSGCTALDDLCERYSRLERPVRLHFVTRADAAVLNRADLVLVPGHAATRLAARWNSTTGLKKIPLLAVNDYSTAIDSTQEQGQHVTSLLATPDLIGFTRLMDELLLPQPRVDREC